MSKVSENRILQGKFKKHEAAEVIGAGHATGRFRLRL